MATEKYSIIYKVEEETGVLFTASTKREITKKFNGLAKLFKNDIDRLMDGYMHITNVGSFAMFEAEYYIVKNY